MSSCSSSVGDGDTSRYRYSDSQMVWANLGHSYSWWTVQYCKEDPIEQGRKAARDRAEQKVKEGQIKAEDVQWPKWEEAMHYESDKKEEILMQEPMTKTEVEEMLRPQRPSYQTKGRPECPPLFTYDQVNEMIEKQKKSKKGKGKGKSRAKRGESRNSVLVETSNSPSNSLSDRRVSTRKRKMTDFLGKKKEVKDDEETKDKENADKDDENEEVSIREAVKLAATTNRVKTESEQEEEDFTLRLSTSDEDGNEDKKQENAVEESLSSTSEEPKISSYLAKVRMEDTKRRQLAAKLSPIKYDHDSRNLTDIVHVRFPHDEDEYDSYRIPGHHLIKPFSNAIGIKQNPKYNKLGTAKATMEYLNGLIVKEGGIAGTNDPDGENQPSSTANHRQKWLIKDMEMAVFTCEYNDDEFRQFVCNYLVEHLGEQEEFVSHKDDDDEWDSKRSKSLKGGKRKGSKDWANKQVKSEGESGRRRGSRKKAAK